MYFDRISGESTTEGLQRQRTAVMLRCLQSNGCSSVFVHSLIDVITARLYNFILTQQEYLQDSSAFVRLHLLTHAAQHAVMPSHCPV